ncbi:MAG: hydantoinase B/oxoprolinase family protein, partial [Gammaproteobacteria bacterium]|nr:hydantoinase B/oxoprolinase family protein [Gammaproteobacteria bacterium]
LLNAEFPSAVAAGNVETSTRIVDVVLGALAQAIPEKIPAASHGSMNNIAMGHNGTGEHAAWDYYETIGGGMGASAISDGQDGVQTHMTNTLNTPIESLEMNYPMRVNRYQIRRGSGGEGKHKGGDGLIREFEFLAPTEVTVLSERRQYAPWGLAGADDGRMGLNHSGQTELSGKFYRHFDEGDSLTIETPGGGGHKSVV